MKRWFKALLGVTLSLMFCCTCIGYAALTDTLTIIGNAQASPPEGFYIIGVEQVPNASLTSTGLDYTLPTNVTSTIRGSRNTSVTYAITVYNNTDYKYAYWGLDYTSSSSYNGNSYIGNGITITTKDNASDTRATFNTSDTVEPRQTRTFYATYTISRTSAANRNLTTFVNYKFGVHIDSAGDMAIDRVLKRFSEILNDTSDGGGYETLTDKIDDKYDGVNLWKSNYIGNVVDSSSYDSTVVNNLFGDNLSINLNGVETNVTLLRKREDVDGNANTGDSYTATYRGNSVSAEGCEMTLYMTTDRLQSGSPTIYAAVFTCNKNADGTYGEWYMIGDMYEGTATIVGYEGGQSTGSFDTGTWRSRSKSYTVTNNYRYSIGQNLTIQNVSQAKDENASKELQTYLVNAKRILDGEFGALAGSAVVDLQAVYDAASLFYTVDANGNLTVNASATRSQVIPHIKKVQNALTPFSAYV